MECSLSLCLCLCLATMTNFDNFISKYCGYDKLLYSNLADLGEF